MADKDFVVKNGLVVGANNVTFGTAVSLASNGNVGIGNTTPADKLVVTGSITATVNVSAASINASTGFYGTVQTATQATIDHNTLANYAADRHIAHSGVSISAGNGLTGGGSIDASRTLSVSAGTGIVSNATGVHVTNVPSALTINNGGAGAASGTTFDGSSAVTISYNSVGAPSITGTNASGTWSININGSAASATNATNASNLGGVAAASYAQLSGATFTGTVSVPSGFVVRKQDNANEGGEFYIEKATNSTLAGNIIVDNNTNSFRIFEGAGSFRGVTLDITGCGSPSVLLHSSNYNSYAPTLTGTGASGTWSININGSAASATNASAATNAGFATSAGSTSQALTFASDGTGAAATTTFNGGTARVISYNSVGAPSITGTNASGTWSININGSSGSTTTATNVSGGTVSATTGSFSSDLSFNSGYGSAAVAYGCRAWIRFATSLGTPSITGDGNVSTITDNGTGAFTINFTTALVDANYGAVANYTETNSATGASNDGQASCHTHATGSVRVFCARGDGSATDPARCTVVVYR